MLIRACDRHSTQHMFVFARWSHPLQYLYVYWYYFYEFLIRPDPG